MIILMHDFFVETIDECAVAPLTTARYCSNAGEFLSSGLDPAPFRLRAGGGLDRDESEPILDCVIESCRALKGRKGMRT
jgi:hypothetical protein